MKQYVSTPDPGASPLRSLVAHNLVHELVSEAPTFHDGQRLVVEVQGNTLVAHWEAVE